MEVFLPIAEVQINIVLFLFVSFVIGFLSGLFGVGGGFLMTPFLIFMGIPPAYAIANEANNILASSTSGSLTHWYKKTMDLKMGWMIISRGLLGTALGMLTFGYFKEINKINFLDFLLAIPPGTNQEQLIFDDRGWLFEIKYPDLNIHYESFQEFNGIVLPRKIIIVGQSFRLTLVSNELEFVS